MTDADAIASWSCTIALSYLSQGAVPGSPDWESLASCIRHGLESFVTALPRSGLSAEQRAEIMRRHEVARRGLYDGARSDDENLARWQQAESAFTSYIASLAAPPTTGDGG